MTGHFITFFSFSSWLEFSLLQALFTWFCSFYCCILCKLYCSSYLLWGEVLDIRVLTWIWEMYQSSRVTTMKFMNQATCKSARKLVGAQSSRGSGLRSSLWFFDNNRVGESCTPSRVYILNQGEKGSIKMSSVISFEIHF